MADMIIHAKKRETVGKSLGELRLSGSLPAIAYGKNAKPSSLTLDLREFEKIYKLAGENTLLDLEVDGARVKVLIAEPQYDPVSDKMIHVDLFQVSMTEELETEIPLKFIGESKAVKDLSGIFFANKHEVTVKCLPADLPHEIQVDISVLETFDNLIHAKDMILPKGVKVLDDLDEVVAQVLPPRSDEELASLEEKPVESVEAVEAVEKKEKEEEVAETPAVMEAKE